MECWSDGPILHYSTTPLFLSRMTERRMKTFSAKPEQIERQWLVIDAAGQSMGRLAVDVARILRGKHKPIFTPNVDTGDFVIVLNAAQIVLTGRKASEKVYRHTGWPGALKFITRGQEMDRKPEEP